MGGGGSGSATPTTPPGYAGGSVMDYSAPAMSNFSPSGAGGFDWHNAIGMLGSGLSSAGKGMGQSQPMPQAYQTPQMSGMQDTGAPYQQQAIPQINFDDVIRRLLGGL